MDKRDKAMHQGLMKILNEGTFELKAREVSAFIEIYNWIKNEVPKKIKEKEPVDGDK